MVSGQTAVTRHNKSETKANAKPGWHTITRPNKNRPTREPTHIMSPTKISRAYMLLTCPDPRSVGFLYHMTRALNNTFYMICNTPRNK